MQRRSFLSAMLAAAAGPAIVRAESLMKLPPAKIIVLGWFEWLGFDLGHQDASWNTAVHYERGEVVWVQHVPLRGRKFESIGKYEREMARIFSGPMRR